MPDLDQVLGAPAITAAGNAQCFEARVTRLTPRGAMVVIPGYSRELRWGPCLPADAAVQVGDKVIVQMSNRGRPWLTVGGAAPARGVALFTGSQPPADAAEGDVWISPGALLQRAGGEWTQLARLGDPHG